MKAQSIVVALLLGSFGLAGAATAVLQSQPTSDTSIEQERRGKKQKKKKKDKDKAQQAALAAPVLPQYERGAYAEVLATVDALGEDAEERLAPETGYVVAWSHEALGESGRATAIYERLAELPATDAWHYVGASGRAVLAGDSDGAVAAANEAVALAPTNLYTHYQRGRALIAAGSFGQAAAAFVAALQVDGDFAYGHYWAGFAYNKSGNLVSMTNHFTRFVELAPESPERTQVEAILAAMR
jgi:tetratricopeptide (TPR) repeat protein